MLRTSRLSETIGLEPIVVLQEKEVPEKEKTDRDRLCDLIFVSDPRTGLPCSDIGMYMNPSTPPQVRDYIQQNLFGDPKTPSDSLGVDDDTICFMTRQSNETVEDYVGRVNSFMLQEKKNVQDSMIAEFAAQRRAALKDLK